jgi:hypothetical protein
MRCLSLILLKHVLSSSIVFIGVLYFSGKAKTVKSQEHGEEGIYVPVVMRSSLIINSILLYEFDKTLYYHTSPLMERVC